LYGKDDGELEGLVDRMGMVGGESNGFAAVSEVGTGVDGGRPKVYFDMVESPAREGDLAHAGSE
jgi:hypothetical protein